MSTACADNLDAMWWQQQPPHRGQEQACWSASLVHLLPFRLGQGNVVSEPLRIWQMQAMPRERQPHGNNLMGKPSLPASEPEPRLSLQLSLGSASDRQTVKA